MGKAHSRTNKNRVSPAKRTVRRILYRMGRAFLILLSVALFIYFAYAMVENHREIAELDEELEVLRQEIEEERSRHEELEYYLDLMEQDTYLEILARKHLRMIKPGDIPLDWTPTEIR